MSMRRRAGLVARPSLLAPACLAIACLVVLAFLEALAGSAWAGCEKPEFRIVIDAGHTKTAPGATSARGATEYDFNVRLTGLIERRLHGAGYVRAVRIITSGGAMSSLMKRVARADALGADLFLSIHHDSVQTRYLEHWTYEGTDQLFSDRFKGWSLFVSPANDHPRESLDFARFLADGLLARGLPFSRHHNEPIPGENKSFLDAARGIYRYDDLIVLKHSRAPAVLLESGVIVNREEEVALAGAERQNAIADAIVEAVDQFCTSERR